MKSTAHPGTHSYMSRKAAGVNCHRRVNSYAFTSMVLRCYTHDAIVFHNRCFNRMTDTEYSARGDGTACQVLIDSSYIENTGNCRMIVQWHFIIGRNKYNFRYGVVQV